MCLTCSEEKNAIIDYIGQSYRVIENVDKITESENAVFGMGLRTAGGQFCNANFLGNKSDCVLRSCFLKSTYKIKKGDLYYLHDIITYRGPTIYCYIEDNTLRCVAIF